MDYMHTLNQSAKSYETPCRQPPYPFTIFRSPVHPGRLRRAQPHKRGPERDVQGRVRRRRWRRRGRQWKRKRTEVSSRGQRQRDGEAGAKPVEQHTRIYSQVRIEVKVKLWCFSFTRQSERERELERETGRDRESERAR
jgi:hypothetical protein